MINILTIRSPIHYTRIYCVFFVVFLLKIGNPLRFVYHWATKWAYAHKAIQLAISCATRTHSNEHASCITVVVVCCSMLYCVRVCFFTHTQSMSLRLSICVHVHYCSALLCCGFISSAHTFHASDNFHHMLSKQWKTVSIGKSQNTPLQTITRHHCIIT